MAGFLYFWVGGPPTVKTEDIKRLGLDYAMASAGACKVNERSPAGKPGTVFGDSARHKGRSIIVDTANQTWRKMPNVEGRPELWVGYWNDAKPGPGDLERPKMLGGYPLSLSDSNVWQVPLVRKFDVDTSRYESALPAYWDFDDEGKPIRGPVIDSYEHLWEVVAQFAEAVFEEDARKPTDAEAVMAATELLKSNYVVDFPELVLLRVFGGNLDAASITLAACDYPVLIQWIAEREKKRGSQLIASGSSSSVSDKDDAA